MKVRARVSSTSVRAVHVLCVAALLLAAPQRADAWFGWLDQFSGPGPFKGALVDFRFLCFGNPTRLGKEDTRDLLSRLTRLIDANSVEARVEAFNALIAVLPALAPSAAAPAALASGRRGPARDGEVDRHYGFVVPDVLLRLRASSPADPSVVDAAREAVVNIKNQTRAALSLATVGTFISRCKTDTARRWSLEANAELWWAGGDERFANGRGIAFITLGPSLTFRVFPNRNFDVLDIGIAAGGYVFHSKGFDDFGGAFVQPQLTFHLPPAWQALPHSDARRWLSAVSYRYGRTYLLEDLSAAALKAAPGIPERIRDGAGVSTSGLFLNLQALLPWSAVDPSR